MYGYRTVRVCVLWRRALTARKRPVRQRRQGQAQQRDECLRGWVRTRMCARSWALKLLPSAAISWGQLCAVINGRLHISRKHGHEASG